MKLLILSGRELDRLTVLKQVMEGRVMQKDAADRLTLSVRQVRRLQRALEQEGIEGFCSKRRAKPCNNRIPDETKEAAIRLMKEHYQGFGPTFAREKLFERHGINISVESLRKFMIQENLWKARSMRKPRIHQSRYRRKRLGELIQIDGSPHDWFEGRASPCCLIGFIDDATSKIQYLKFTPVESTEAYLDALEEYVVRYGRPKAFYSDKHSVFRINNRGESYKGTGTTQFSRALKELGVDLICANSPQAKGRVERMFGTLQDRLTKELRLAGANNLEDGNAFLPAFLEAHNSKFAVDPEVSGDCHLPLLPSHQLDRIICLKETRKLSKNLELSFEGDLYQVITKRPTYAMRGATVEALRKPKGQPTFWYKGQALECRRLITRDNHGRIEGRKKILDVARPPRGADNRQVA